MKYKLLVIALVLLCGVALAQKVLPPRTPPGVCIPAPGSQPPVPMVLCANKPAATEQIDVNRLAALMLSWQYQFPQPRTPGYDGQATRLTIIGRHYPSDIINSMRSLIYGWKDCENSFLCLGGTAYFPIEVRIITGEAGRAYFEQFSVGQGIAIPGINFNTYRAKVYSLKNAPKNTIWLVEHPRGDYLFSGGLLEGKGTTTSAVRSLGLASTILVRMEIDKLLTQPGVSVWVR
jgi:hypothetical protein